MLSYKFLQDDISSDVPKKKQKFNIALSEESSLSPKSVKTNELLNECKDNDDQCRLLKDKTNCSSSKKLDLGSSSEEIIKQLFLMDMPDDFYSFWKMCEKQNSSDPASKFPIK
jgi:hypothetical protein